MGELTSLTSLLLNKSGYFSLNEQHSCKKYDGNKTHHHRPSVNGLMTFALKTSKRNDQLKVK